MAFAFVSIATGIFTTYGAVLNSSGPVGIWTWPIAVIGQLAVAFVLGALAARIPVTGYHYQWMSRLANPVLGWILGWISFTFLAIVVVAVDYTIASTIFPVLLNYEGTATIAWVVTAVVLLIQALLVGFSTPWAERVNNAFVSLELDRHGRADGAAAGRRRRARGHGLLEPVQQGRRAAGRLLELR